MGFLGLETDIAVTDGVDVGTVDVRVEVTDARTADAEVVGEADVGHHAEVVLHAGGGDEVAVVEAEVGAGAALVAHLLEGVLIAEPGFAAPFFAGEGVFAVGPKDAVEVGEFDAACGIGCPVAALQGEVTGVGVVGPGDELSPGRERAADAQRGSVVELGSLLDHVFLIVRMTVVGVAVVGHVGVVAVGAGGEEVGGCERAAFHASERALVVESGAVGGPAVGDVGVGVVGEEGGTARADHRAGAALEFVGVEVQDADGGREQAERVDLVAGGDVGEDAGGFLGHVGSAGEVGKDAAVGVEVLKGGGGGHSIHRLVHCVDVGADGEFAFLTGEEEAAAEVAVGVGFGLDGGVVAVLDGLLAG